MCIAILYLFLYVKLEKHIPSLRVVRRRAFKALVAFVGRQVRQTP